MTRTISATEARIHLGDVMRAVVEKDETIIVERSGKPLVVFISIDHYRRLKDGTSDAEDWLERAERVAARIQRERNGRPLPDISEVIHDLREERDAQLVDDLLRR
jgi:prevent-host-death family protein